MPTRISAGVGDPPCFVTFYNYDPYRLKLLIFPYSCHAEILSVCLPVYHTDNSPGTAEIDISTA